MFTRTLYLLLKYCLLNIKNKKRMNEAATTSSPNLNWNKYIPTSGLLKIITKKIKVSNPILKSEDLAEICNPVFVDPNGDRLRE